MKLCREIPVIQGDERLDAVGKKFVDQVRIELDAERVDFIVSSSLGNDT